MAAVTGVRRPVGALGVTITNAPPTRPALCLPSAHHGLTGLRERAENLKGNFASGPTADGATTPGCAYRPRREATPSDDDAWLRVWQVWGSARGAHLRGAVSVLVVFGVDPGRDARLDDHAGGFD